LKIFENFQIYNANGIKIVDTNQVAIGEKKSFEQELFKTNPYETNLNYRYDHYSKQEIISLTQFILDENDKQIGMLVGNFPQKTLTKLIFSNYSDEIQNRVDLIRDDGQILFSNYNTEIYAIDSLNEIKNNLKNNSKDFYFTEDDKFFKAYSKSSIHISNSFNNWYMSTSIDKTFIYGPIYKRSLYFGIITLIILSLFTLLSFRLARSLTRNIEIASSAIAELGKGNFNTLANLNVSNDEIGFLISNLKSMSEEINFLIEDQKNKTQMAAVGKMAGSIAHEINNPMHLMTNQIKQIEKILERNNIDIKNDLDRLKLNRNFKTIYFTTERIKKIILKLKDLTHNEVIDQPHKTNIAKILHDISNHYLVMTEENGIIFKSRTIDFPIYANCRSSQIIQVLDCIINNAIEATNSTSDKWISLCSFVKDNSFVIEISNSGQKISQENSEQIFSPNFSMKNNVMRVGMSLAISKSILESIRSKFYLAVEKEFTTFVIEIPIIENSELQNTDDKAAS
jgi:C4-dicarboxylate-specific signal transduction histidine kinase